MRISLLASASAAQRQLAGATQADTIFLNGNIYTGNEQQPHAEAVAVKGDRITFVGSTEEAQQLVGKTTRD